jgi:hypothetical protein
MVIREVDQAFLTIQLTKYGNFVTFDARSGNLKKIDCPEKIARYLLAKQEWGFLHLVGIINAPTLRNDGSIVDQPGYDAASGLLFLAGFCDFEPIPQEPTFEDAVEAKNELLQVVADFPFEDEASRSVALAAILTALVRKSISTAPIFGFTAPKMASGKSLLADVVALIATGKINSVIAQAENEAEEKKRILALLSEGDQIICFDNIERPFNSPALCAILTQQEYKDRLLGENETRTVSTNVTFLVTGNNLHFSGDISTRALLCKLDPQLEHPEERTFNINLREYIPQNRGRLVKTGLTILRAFHVAGKPPQNIKPFGRFEDWSNWIRSAIVWLGMVDPCETRKDIENSDPIRQLLSKFFIAWYKIFGNRQIKAKELVTVASLAPGEAYRFLRSSSLEEAPESLRKSFTEAHDLLHESLVELATDNKGVINTRSLAGNLKSYKNRIENGLRLEQSGTRQGTSLWRIKKIIEKR